VTQRGEVDILRRRLRLASLDKGRDREPDPRDHQRPRFHAPVPVNAFFEGLALEDILELPRRRLVALAFNRNAPGLRLELARIPGRIVLLDAEFVEIVIRGDLFPRVDLVGWVQRAERTLENVRKLLFVWG